VVTLPHGETVTRLRATAAADPYSGENTDLDWTDPDELTITGVAVEPARTSEPFEDDGRIRVDIDFRLYVPYQADIQPLDRLVVRGETYEPEGMRLDWRNPYTGDTPGSVVDVRRVLG
jgi:hypothetical protein